MRLAMRGASLALDTWRERAAEQRRLRGVASAVVQRMLHRRLAAALGRWAEGLARDRRTVSAMLRAVTQMRCLGLGRAFSQWRDGAFVASIVTEEARGSLPVLSFPPHNAL